jgi:rhodanese-related sulfurtransferase
VPTSLKTLLEAAHQAVPAITPDEAKAMLDRGEAVAVDVRDALEVQRSGRVPGALNIPRGMLEFKADAGAPSHDPRLAADKAVILYCAAGGRAALAGKTLKDLGYDRVFNLGGFSNWAGAGLPVEPAEG